MYVPQNSSDNIYYWCWRFTWRWISLKHVNRPLILKFTCSSSRPFTVLHLYKQTTIRHFTEVVPMFQRFSLQIYCKKISEDICCKTSNGLHSLSTRMPPWIYILQQAFCEKRFCNCNAHQLESVVFKHNAISAIVNTFKQDLQ